MSMPSNIAEITGIGELATIAPKGWRVIGYRTYAQNWTETTNLPPFTMLEGQRANYYRMLMKAKAGTTAIKNCKYLDGWRIEVMLWKDFAQ